MARSVSRTRVVVRQSYYWPDQQLNFWILVVLATGGTLIGIGANFVQDQQQLGLGIPWILPYSITVGSLTVLFICMMLGLIYQRRLLPAVVIIGAFILFVLYLAGLIGCAIQIFGAGQIDANCQAYVNSNPSRGLSLETLAWLEQNGTCQAWLALFSFWIVGAVFWVWMLVLASMVAQGGVGQ